MGFNLIYWTPICGEYFLHCSILEKCGKIWKNGRFSGRLRPDWGNTARAATARMGSKGLNQMLGGKVDRVSSGISPIFSGEGYSPMGQRDRDCLPVRIVVGLLLIVCLASLAIPVLSPLKPFLRDSCGSKSHPLTKLHK